MRLPGIGCIVVDLTRRELGSGVLRGWIIKGGHSGYAQVKFASGVKYVHPINCRSASSESTARKPRYSLREWKKAKKYGLTVRQYRKAMKA